jgi:hypothetical protein
MIAIVNDTPKSIATIILIPGEEHIKPLTTIGK